MASTYPVPFNEEARLAELHGLPGLTVENEGLFDTLTDLARKIFDCPVGHISIVDDERLWYKSVVGIDLGTTPRGESFCAHTIMRDEVLVVPDMLQDNRFKDHPNVAAGGHVRYYVGAPIKLSTGFRIGSLCALDFVPHRMPSEKDIQTLRHLTKAMASAIENKPKRTKVDRSQVVDVLALLDREMHLAFDVVKTGLEKLQGRQDDDRDVQYSRALGRFTNHLEEIIGNMIALGDPMTADLPIEEEFHDVKKVVCDVVEMFFPDVSNGLENVEVDRIDLPGSLWMDAALMRIALASLSMGALRSGATCLRFGVRVTDDGMIALTVTDNGQINGRSLYLRDTAHEGTGTSSMSLSRKLIEMHGGRLDVRDEEDGTVAYASLPGWRKVGPTGSRSA